MGFTDDSAGATFLPVLVFDEVERLVGRDRHQQPPQVVTIGKLREPAALQSAAESIEGTEGDVFLVRRTSRQFLELLARQPDQPLEIPFPELLGSSMIAGLELTHPMRDRTARRHRGLAPEKPFQRG